MMSSEHFNIKIHLDNDFTNIMLESTKFEYLSEKIIAEFIHEETIFIIFGKRMSINRTSRLAFSFLFYQIFH